MDHSYTPVQYVYKEVIAEEIEKGTVGKVFYFSEGNTVEEVRGSIMSLAEVEKKRGIHHHGPRGSGPYRQDNHAVRKAGRRLR